MFFSVFSGLVPALIGSMIYKLKQTTANGEKDFVFSEEGRSRGLAIAITGVLSTIGWYYYARHGFQVH